MKLSNRAARIATALGVSLLGGALFGCSADAGAGSPDNLDQALAQAVHFTNPVIPMFERPAGVPRGYPANYPGHPSEGCPDPTGLKTRSGDFYIYCTSYTYAWPGAQYMRRDAFPIFKSKSRGIQGPWERVGSIIPDGGRSRHTWPRWVKNEKGEKDGNFWAPDVHELPNGKFAAVYAGKCGKVQCVGIAWSDSPEEGWTHRQEPLIDRNNNGTGNPDTTTYDGNLLVTSSGELYLYWYVAGNGAYGAKVTAKPSGEIELASAPFRAAGRGEGPYVIEHKGAFYEFYSIGSLLFDYHVGVRRATSPEGPFDDERKENVGGVERAVRVLERSKDSHFVATGGNSFIANAVNGTDFMVYHAIVVPRGGGCPARDPDYGHYVKKIPWHSPDNGDANPHCRGQGERQAMIDPVEWRVDGAGVEWPYLMNGTGRPSEGSTRVP